MVVQEGLWLIILTRRIQSREDNALVALVTGLDYKLPMSPLWDPNGVVIGKVHGMVRSDQALGRSQGVFRPHVFGTDWSLANGWSEAKFNEQVSLKEQILWAVYPGLEKEADELIARVIIRNSPLTLKAMNEKPNIENLGTPPGGNPQGLNDMAKIIFKLLN